MEILFIRILYELQTLDNIYLIRRL